MEVEESRENGRGPAKLTSGPRPFNTIVRRKRGREAGESPLKGAPRPSWSPPKGKGGVKLGLRRPGPAKFISGPPAGAVKWRNTE